MRRDPGDGLGRVVLPLLPADARRPSRLSAWGSDDGGASAIEFALVAPLLLLVLLGGYQMSEAVSAYRKTTLTARTVADLTTRYSTLGTSDVATVLNASAQVMAPFDTAALSIVLTEYKAPASGSGPATVTWSKALNGTALTPGTAAMLPAGLCMPNASVVQAVVTYTFTPAVVSRLTGPIPMSSVISMSPRAVASIAYTGT